MCCVLLTLFISNSTFLHTCYRWSDFKMLFFKLLINVNLYFCCIVVWLVYICVYWTLRSGELTVFICTGPICRIIKLSTVEYLTIFWFLWSKGDNPKKNSGLYSTGYWCSLHCIYNVLLTKQNLCLKQFCLSCVVLHNSECFYEGMSFCRELQFVVVSLRSWVHCTCSLESGVDYYRLLNFIVLAESD